MHIKSLAIPCCLAISAAACVPNDVVTPLGQTVPRDGLTMGVVGISTNSSESFKGVLFGEPFGDGRLEIVTSTDARCQGTYSHVSRTEGFGEVVCTDGRRGGFAFTSKGTSGEGKGNLGRTEFLFSFKTNPA